MSSIVPHIAAACKIREIMSLLRKMLPGIRSVEFMDYRLKWNIDSVIIKSIKLDFKEEKWLF